MPPNIHTPYFITNDGTNLYVVNSYSGIGSEIVKITSDGIITLLAGSSSLGSSDGTGASASFLSISSIVYTNSNLYVLDNGNRIRIISLAGNVTTMTITGTNFFDGNENGLTTDGSNLYTVNISTGDIYKIVISSGAMSLLKTLSGANLAYLTYGNGNLYLNDTVLISTLYIVTINTLSLSTLTTGGSSISFLIYYNNSGTDYLYYSDSPNTTFNYYNSTDFYLMAGSSIGYKDGDGNIAEFDTIKGITLLNSYLYVTDANNNAIRKISIVSPFIVSTFAKSGGGVPCFPLGTKILTAEGYKPVETLKQQELVLTADGRQVPVKIYGKIITKTNQHTAPYLIPAHSLGLNNPRNDLKLSPDHAFMVRKGVWMIPRKAVLMSDKVVQYGIGESVTYFHLECPNFFRDNLVIEGGVVAESYAAKQANFTCPYTWSEKLQGYTRNNVITKALTL